MDEPQHRSFLLVRGLLDRAVASVDGTEPGAMTSVILNDLAVETAAKATVAVHPPSVVPFPGEGYLVLTSKQKQEQHGRVGDPSLPHVLDELLASSRSIAGNLGPVREIREAAKLHELRNRIQHEAEIPSLPSVERARTRALGFVSWVLDAFFDESIDRISRASLIRSESVRALIEKAERHAVGHGHDLETAAQHVAIALKFARLEFQSGQPYGERRRRLRASDVEAAIGELREGSDPRDYRSYRRVRTLFEVMAGTMEQLADRIEAVTLGAQVSEYVWFRRHFPEVVDLTSLNGPVELAPQPVPAGMTRETYERGRDFVIDAALHWQQFPTPPAAEDGEPTL